MGYIPKTMVQVNTSVPTSNAVSKRSLALQAQGCPSANTNAAGQGKRYRPPVLVMRVGLQTAAEIGPVLENQ